MQLKNYIEKYNKILLTNFDKCPILFSTDTHISNQHSYEGSTLLGVTNTTESDLTGRVTSATQHRMPWGSVVTSPRHFIELFLLRFILRIGVRG